MGSSHCIQHVRLIGLSMVWLLVGAALDSQTARGEDPPADILVVTVNARGELVVSGGRTLKAQQEQLTHFKDQFAELAKKAKDKKQDGVNTTIIVRAPDDLDYLSVFKVLSAAQEAGFERCQFHALTKEEPKPTKEPKGKPKKPQMTVVVWAVAEGDKRGSPRAVIVRTENGESDVRNLDGMKDFLRRQRDSQAIDSKEDLRIAPESKLKYRHVVEVCQACQEAGYRVHFSTPADLDKESSDPAPTKAQLEIIAKAIQEARTLRMAKKFTDARKQLDDVFANDWGKTFEVRKEIAQTWMDENKYGAAAVKWSETITSFGPRPDFANRQVKENYFEARYGYTYCLYRYAKNIDANDAKLGPKKPEYIKRAAKLILQLEMTPPNDYGGEQFKKRYDELLKNEEPLRKAYEELKKDEAKE
jgi:biopolymer transport protein ExbD